MSDTPLWNPGIAAVLSLLIPGLGQIYRTKILEGLVWMFIVLCGYHCLVIPGIVLHIICICLAASGNRYNQPNL